MNKRGAAEGYPLSWRHVGFVVAVAAMGLVGVALLLNSSGIFYRSVADEFGVGLGQVSFYISLSYIASMPLLPLGARLMERWSVRGIYVVVNIALAVAFFLNAMAVNVWMMYVAGVLSCGCIVFNMYLMPVLVARWFKKRVGFVVGLAGSCTGLGAAIWNVMGSAIITTAGWRVGYAVFGAMVLAIIVPLVLLFVRSNPEDVGIKRYGSSEGDEDVAHIQRTEAVTGADYAAVVKSPAFFLLIVMSLCGGLVAVMSQYLTSFALDAGYIALVGASMTSAAMVGNMLTKIVFGGLADKSLLSSVLGAVVLPGIALAGLMLIGGGSTIGVVSMAFLFGGVQPSNTVILPLVVRGVFGEKDYSRIWASVSPFSALACAVGATIWGWIYDGTGSFYLVFVIGISLLVIRLVAYLAAARSARGVPHTVETTVRGDAAR